MWKDAWNDNMTTNIKLKLLVLVYFITKFEGLIKLEM